MLPTPQRPSDGIVRQSSLKTSQVNDESENQALRKTQVELKGPNNHISSEEEDIPPENRLEILYDGHYYDVTDFIKIHPGGDEIIQEFVDSGEDATKAIQQFHHRSIKMVMGRMKGLEKRPATDEESKSCSLKSGQNRSMSSFINKVRSWIQPSR